MNKKQNTTEDKNQKSPTVKDDVLNRIKRESLTPRAKWLCFCKDNLIWVLWVLTVIIGAVGFSEVIYVSLHSGIEFYDLTHLSLTAFVLDSLPLVWIVLFVLMVGLAYYNLRNTKRGYRYPFWQIISSSFVFTLIIGFGLNTAGVNMTIDRMMSRMPMPMPYQSVEDRQAYLWAHPEDGRITGSYVVHLEEDMHVSFKDAVDREWIVMIHELPPKDISLLLTGKKVRLLGEADTTVEPHFFYGCAVLPWMKESGDSVQSIRENRARLYERVQHFGGDRDITETSPLRCREILRSLVRE